MLKCNTSKRIIFEIEVNDWERKKKKKKERRNLTGHFKSVYPSNQCIIKKAQKYRAYAHNGYETIINTCLAQ